METISFEKEQLFLLRYLYFLSITEQKQVYDAFELLAELPEKIDTNRVEDWVKHLQKYDLLEIIHGVFTKIAPPELNVRISQEGKIYYQENRDQFKEFDFFFDAKSGKKIFEMVENANNSRNYWLVGSYWYYSQPRERLPLFNKNNEWVDGRGKESEFARLTNQVKTGDVLICKSSYYSTANKTSTLRLKGFGTVTNNPLDGEKLQVKWEATNWTHDIPKYGYYRDTIHQVREEDLERILKELENAKKGLPPEEDSFNQNPPLHTLSTTKEDPKLKELGYDSQGLIGYAKKQFKDSILARRFLGANNNNLVFTHVANELLSTNDFEDEGLGSLFRTPSSTSIKLRKFYHGDPLEYVLICTNPDVEKLADFGYDEELLFDETYFLESKQSAESTPIYLYSTDSETHFFEPLPEPDNYDLSSRLHSDSPSDEDSFERGIITQRVTDQVNDLFDSGEYEDSYTILLDGEWGSGKSSMLNFFRKNLKKSSWKVIDYNAWENQSFNDPWWILINSISKKATEDNFDGSFHSHRYWKFKMQYRHRFWAVALLVAFGVSAYFFATSEGYDANNIPFIGSLLGIIGTVVSIITGLASNFFFKSVSSEGLREEFSDHPYKEIRARFNEIAESNKLAIIIDDLDRCNVNATVSLLESIQTLFKGQKVLYIIAADGKWVSQCFTKKYADFESIAEPGISIGDKFLQKNFQLRVPVPNINEDLLEAYYDSLIDHVESEIEESNDTEPTTQKTELPIKSDVKIKAEATRQKLEEQSEEIQEEIKENEPKYLKQFSEKFKGSKLASNPRQLKRFVNQYAVERQVRNIETGETEYPEAEVENLMIRMCYPSLSRMIDEGLITENDLDEKSSENKKELLKGLTQSQIEEIKKLLE